MLVAIRGAITVEENTKEAILNNTKELLEKIIKKNDILQENIISIHFSVTKDLDAVYPAVMARELGITKASLMCFQEMNVAGSLEKCIRTEILVEQENLNRSNVKAQYLKNAKRLRPDLSNHFSIAIDGPAGAGKSTIAKQLAKALKCVYVDTGAMYRSVAYYCLEKNMDIHNQEQVNQSLPQIDIQLKYDSNVGQRILLNNEDVSQKIRTEIVSQSASKVATYQKVRSTLVEMQQDMAKSTSLIMDGRDIGTVVLPNATLKIFLTASVEERAKRRLKDYNMEGDLEKLKEEISQRDKQDMEREISPLKKADDAIEIDTTHMTIEEIVLKIQNLLNERI